IMNVTFKRPVYLLTCSLIINGLLINPLLAEPIYHPSGPKLTFGGMTHRQLTVSDMGNPAHPASIPIPEGDSGLYGAGLSIGLGIEYDGNDNLFKLLDQAGSDEALAPGDGSTPDDGQDSDNTLENIIGSIVGTPTPEQEAELQALADEITVKAAALGAFLLTSVTGLNAKAFVSADVPILISHDSIGAWTFGANTSITTNLKGINDPITFISSDELLAALQNVYNLDTTDSVTTYDLGSAASITVDPATGETTFQFENNSGTITRAAQITELSVGYSRKVWQQEDNEIYVGIKPKFFDVGLSNNFVFISNIENARDIFNALDKSSFNYTQDVGLDLGTIWSSKQYQLGATLTNINEPDFQFPAIDLSGITNPDIKNAILNTQTYVMERQLKLDAGYITPGGAWGLNFGLDANAVPDPMMDDYQWVSVGAGFASDSWWLPGARIGARKNMAGTKLTYITAGVTVFNIVNLDLATTTDTITINGKTVPRGLIVNIGAQVLF
ncbi:MAG: conjugal transfer protein TraF, partial [Proteobacteria bacterium]|nr:conjugal transfer protein TraF [Pseudomonadota bacterium]